MAARLKIVVATIKVFFACLIISKESKPDLVDGAVLIQFLNSSISPCSTILDRFCSIKNTLLS